MEFQYVLMEVKDHVAYITLNNPQKRNPINIDTGRELKECFDRCDYDESIRLVVIRGAGGTFSAGGDINAMKARIDAGIRGTRPVCRMLGEAFLRLRNVKKPTIAYIEGSAAGAGLSLALACDFQIADEAAKCLFAFVNLGFVPDSGATYFVTRAVGTTRATELFMSGKVFTGRDAEQWGLFTKAVPAAELEETVQKYIKKYANGPTVSYANIKTMINRAQFDRYSDGMQTEIELQGMCEETDDFKEAVNAFLEKRKPNFQGR
ncbi:MAG: enoyl-CoA hydratase [Oscillospiraceae bacterium]|nr:enoyl-CoA hydratase [Oscillospiraceae bacterium]